MKIENYLNDVHVPILLHEYLRHSIVNKNSVLVSHFLIILKNLAARESCTERFWSVCIFSLDCFQSFQCVEEEEHLLLVVSMALSTAPYQRDMILSASL